MKSKKTNDHYIRKYIELSGVSKPRGLCYFLLDFFFYLCYVIFSLLVSIFNAKTINGIYIGIDTGDFSYCYTNLAIEATCVIFYCLFNFGNYYLYPVSYSYSYDRIQNRLLDKIMGCENVNFKTTSRQKIFSIVGNDVGTLADFFDCFAYRTTLILYFFFPLVYIFNANYYVGLFMIAFLLINFFANRWINKKIGKGTKMKSEAKDSLFEQYNSTMDGRKVIQEFDSYEQEHKKLNKVLSEKHTKAYKYYYRSYGVRENIFLAINYVIIYVVIFFFIMLISNDSFDVETYLVVVPYLSTCLKNFISFSNISEKFEDLHVSVNRIETILNFSDKEFESFGNLTLFSTFTADDLSLINIHHENTRPESTNYGKIEGLDMSFKNKSINVVKGEHGCGKRIIFNMLRRNIKPKEGQILIDGKNIYDYDKKSYFKLCYYASSHPIFLNDTILNNMKVVCSNTKKIKQVFSELDLLKKIDDLPEKFNTNIYEAGFSTEEFFILGVARAILNEPKYLIIYETPNVDNSLFTEKFIIFLKKLTKSTTVIVFTYSNNYDSSASLVYEMENYKIKNVIENK